LTFIVALNTENVVLILASWEISSRSVKRLR